MVPSPLQDVSGMLPAIALLDRSLDKGVHLDHVRWGTFRKAMLAVTNVTQAGVGGLGDSVLGAYERNRTWISSVATHQFWYSHFMHGVHKRVGKVRKPDRIITIDVLHAVDKVPEAEWKQSYSIRQAKDLRDRCLDDGRLLYRSLRGRNVVGRHVGDGNKCSEIDER